jgi:hypothetical protein
MSVVRGSVDIGAKAAFSRRGCEMFKCCRFDVKAKRLGSDDGENPIKGSYCTLMCSRCGNGPLYCATCREGRMVGKWTCFNVGLAFKICVTVSEEICGWTTNFSSLVAHCTMSIKVEDMACGKLMNSRSVRLLHAFATFFSTSKCSKRCIVTRVSRFSERRTALSINLRGTGRRAPERSRCIHSRGSLDM